MVFALMFNVMRHVYAALRDWAVVMVYSNGIKREQNTGN